jgi:hypothetical protein
MVAKPCPQLTTRSMGMHSGDCRSLDHPQEKATCILRHMDHTAGLTIRQQRASFRQSRRSIIKAPIRIRIRTTLSVIISLLSITRALILGTDPVRRIATPITAPDVQCRRDLIRGVATTRTFLPPTRAPTRLTMAKLMPAVWWHPSKSYVVWPTKLSKEPLG